MRTPSRYIAVVCLSLFSTPAFSQSASSSGYALGVNQTVTVPLVADATVIVGPLAATSGSAPPNYNLSNSVVSVNQTAALTTGLVGISQRLQTGLLTSNSMGTATGASANATINNLTLGVGPTTVFTSFLPSLLGLGATTIQSQSTASSVGGLSASGVTIIEGLTLTGSVFNNFTFDSSLFVNPNPNTVLFNALGLSIILNEQIFSGNGVTSTGITTNAIHIGFNNFVAGAGLTNGDIIFGQTRASINAVSGAVPETSTWVMMVLGFGAIGFSIRKRPGKIASMLA
jgi:hypothetical protein